MELYRAIAQIGRERHPCVELRSLTIQINNANLIKKKQFYKTNRKYKRSTKPNI